MWLISSQALAYHEDSAAGKLMSNKEKAEILNPKIEAINQQHHNVL